jgi:tRNA-splicing ligase RtcB
VELKSVRDNVWEIPASGIMRAPVRIYASKALLDGMSKDRTLLQAVNVSALPGVLNRVLVMPDGHEGYGFPIGGVAAFPAEDGLVSPGGIGYDINCGIRLLRTGLTEDEVRPEIGKLVGSIFREIPSGVGREGNLDISDGEFLEAITQGSRWAMKKGYATKKDVSMTEENGSMPSSQDSVSRKAISRGRSQLGTLGAGNHFIEIQKVDKVFSPVAGDFGLKEGEVVVMIHTGSRGFGHQVASDYISLMMSKQKEFNAGLPDKELAAAPLDSPEGEAYLDAMMCAVNFAFVNRQVISFFVRNVFSEIFSCELSLLYDVAHNIGKFEDHGRRVFVHRKGATRAFGPGRKELPEEFQRTGQPVIIPGSMGTSSYVLAGRGFAESFESTCHGAGRRLSRSGALREARGDAIKDQLEKRGISVRSGSVKSLAEEAPGAYKDIDEVVKVVHSVGISDMVARTVPLGVVKG